MKQLNYATALGFIFMSILATKFNTDYRELKSSGKTNGPEGLNSNISMLQQDSLCNIWVTDTAQRIAFKHWYNKQLKKTK